MAEYHVTKDSPLPPLVNDDAEKFAIFPLALAQAHCTKCYPNTEENKNVRKFLTYVFMPIVYADDLQTQGKEQGLATLVLDGSFARRVVDKLVDAYASMPTTPPIANRDSLRARLMSIIGVEIFDASVAIHIKNFEDFKHRAPHAFAKMGGLLQYLLKRKIVTPAAQQTDSAVS